MRSARAMPKLETLPDWPRGVCELVAGPRHHERVVLQGIAKARRSVDLMTADLKAMLVPELGMGRNAPSILAVLADLAKRGVEVRLLHAGVPSSAALAQLKRLAKRVGGMHAGLSLRRCPRLHAKAIVIDAEQMYLGSANLTGAGLGAKGDRRRNFELGVWTHEPAMIDAVLDHFNALWEGHECETCGRRDVCPEPLEEPNF